MTVVDSKTWTQELVLQRRALWEGALCPTLSTAQSWSRMDSLAGSGPFNKLRLMMVSNAQGIREEGKEANLCRPLRCFEALRKMARGDRGGTRTGLEMEQNKEPSRDEWKDGWVDGWVDQH